MKSVPERPALQPPTLEDVRRMRAALDEHEVARGMDALARLLRIAADEIAQADQDAEGEP